MNYDVYSQLLALGATEEQLEAIEKKKKRPSREEAESESEEHETK